MSCHRVLRVLCCATLFAGSAQSEKMREKMLKRFHSHYDDFANDEFEWPHKDKGLGLSVYISKDDVTCGATKQPYYYIDFEVPDVRPVDVFNVMAEFVSQPSWLCNGCQVSVLKNDLEEKVQGMSNAVKAPLMPMREFLFWNAFEIDLDAEEFLVGSVGDHNVSELQSLSTPIPGAVQAVMCYSFTHMTRSPTGTHVVQMTHFDPMVPHLPFNLLSARSTYGWVWPMLVKRVPRIIERAKWQAARNWTSQQVSIPREFLEDTPEQLSRIISAAATPADLFPVARNASGEGGDFFSSYVLGISVIVFCCSCAMCASGIYCCCRPGKTKKDCDDACWSLVDDDHGSAGNSEDEFATVLSQGSISSSVREIRECVSFPTASQVE